MDCVRASEFLHGYLDDELDVAHAGEMEAHLAACASCRREHEQYLSLRSLLRERAPRFAAPARLRSQVQASLRSARRVQRLRDWAPMGWLQFAGSLAAAIVLSSTVTYYWMLASNTDRAVGDVVEAHVRALVTNHITDVASSDRHTVKPWFNGKLDFSPPVKDLAAEEFPLVGGRLDYIGGRPVAVLLYRHNQHWISVFVWPDQTDKDGARRAFSKHGYDITSWSGAGMHFYVVSDIAGPELGRFVALLGEQNTPK
jgi:anti-sigma factor RsiW